MPCRDNSFKQSNDIYIIIDDRYDEASNLISPRKNDEAFESHMKELQEMIS
jgi:hypothetical protein